MSTVLITTVMYWSYRYRKFIYWHENVRYYWFRYLFYIYKSIFRWWICPVLREKLFFCFCSDSMPLGLPFLLSAGILVNNKALRLRTSCFSLTAPREENTLRDENTCNGIVRGTKLKFQIREEQVSQATAPEKHNSSYAITFLYIYLFFCQRNFLSWRLSDMYTKMDVVKWSQCGSLIL